MKDLGNIPKFDEPSVKAFLAAAGITTTVPLVLGKELAKEPDGPDDTSKIIEVLKNIGKPLTRDEISRESNVSISKTRKILSDLLEDDDRIKEVREGKIRKIRYTGGSD